MAAFRPTAAACSTEPYKLPRRSTGARHRSGSSTHRSNFAVSPASAAPRGAEAHKDAASAAPVAAAACSTQWYKPPTQPTSAPAMGKSHRHS